jgi:phosphate:Na+ symporter
MELILSGRARNYIVFSVRKPFYGLVTGIIATILFQSSSATTLLTVGMVSAGLISFFHSLGIILGADIGTTLTTQLVAWKVTTLSPIFMLLGGSVWLLGKDKWKAYGEAIVYFGFIFFGLGLLSEATEPVKSSPLFLRFFLETRSPLFGIAVGILFTAIVQASAIPISILVIMAAQGIVNIDSSLPIVLGANIGTTVTALMGSSVGNVDGRKSALSHLIFKCTGVVICLAAFPFFLALLRALTWSPAQQIVFGHFLCNLVTAAAFFFLLKPFSLLMGRLMPGKSQTIPLWPEFLDPAVLGNAEEALTCAQKELDREIQLTRMMLTKSLDLIPRFNRTGKRSISYIEAVVDNLQAEITRYLWNISCGDLSPGLSRRLFAFSAAVNDIERIGDRSVNLMELAESRHIRQAFFSDAAIADLEEIGRLVLGNLDDAAGLIEKRNEETIRIVMEGEAEIKAKTGQAAKEHLDRFYRKICRAEAGPIFMDMLTNLERISENCRLIAEHIQAGGEQEV